MEEWLLQTKKIFSIQVAVWLSEWPPGWCHERTYWYCREGRMKSWRWLRACSRIFSSSRARPLLSPAGTLEDLKMAEIVQQKPCQTTPLLCRKTQRKPVFRRCTKRRLPGVGASFRCIYWSPVLGNSFSLICMVIISIKCLQCRIWAYSDLGKPPKKMVFFRNIS